MTATAEDAPPLPGRGSSRQSRTTMGKSEKGRSKALNASKSRRKVKGKAKGKLKARGKTSARKATKKREKKPAAVLTAHEMARQQREISVSEFFTKNRHLLGFDSPRKALLTTIKEAVDNSLDACEEAGILPNVKVVITPCKMEGRFVVAVEDNGPGILKKQVPLIFAKLLYGSKFHRLKMSRGQQGIGISAAGMYGQLTTGKPLRVTSKHSAKQPAHRYELLVDTKKNEPKIVKEDEIRWDKDRGTKVEIELEAVYQKGKQSVDAYLEQTAIANPHVTLTYCNPQGEVSEYKRVTMELPEPTKEIKPHPYGIEMGILIKMLHETRARTLKSFLMSEFSRVSSRVADEICERAKLATNARPSRIARQEADALLQAIRDTKIMNPPSNCVRPIGEELILRGLEKQVEAELYLSATRPPAVYRGNPFQVEVGLAYGGSLPAERAIRLLRYANRVPLLFQQSSCAITKSTISTSWRKYGLQQSNGALPNGPITILVHVASVWVPFTSESKEGIASYPEIIKEIKLALQQCGRELGRHLRRARRAAEEERKRSHIEKYIPHIGIALQEILELSDAKRDGIVTRLTDVLERSRKP